jgi:sorting nexin-4
MSNSEVFDSVVWDTAPPSSYDAAISPNGRVESSSRPGYRQESIQSSHDPKWEGYLDVEVKDPVKELEHTKDAYVSYLVVGRVRNACSSRESCQADVMTLLRDQTNLTTFSTRNPQARRRFQDFVFLRESLANDFPACVVPPLPGKHRLGKH